MTYHIPYLDDALLISAILFPTGIGGLLALPFRWKANKSMFYSLIGMVVAYMIVIILTFAVKPEAILTFNSTYYYFYLLAPFIGILVLLFEYYIGVLQLYFKTGKLVTKFNVHTSYSNYKKIGVLDIVAILIFVIGEELILRQTFALMFLKDFQWGVGITIFLCAFIYAINHITFGLSVVVQKLASGLIYTVLYYISGLAIIIPIVAHATQNLALLALSRKGERYG